MKQQLDLNDARTLLLQRSMRKAIRHARALKTGRVRHLQRRYVQSMAERLRRELSPTQPPSTAL